MFLSNLHYQFILVALLDKQNYQFIHVDLLTNIHTCSTIGQITSSIQTSDVRQNLSSKH